MPARFELIDGEGLLCLQGAGGDGRPPLHAGAGGRPWGRAAESLRSDALGPHAAKAHAFERAIPAVLALEDEEDRWALLLHLRRLATGGIPDSSE